jgi:hypothetical protein
MNDRIERTGRTPVDDAGVMEIFDGFEDHADKVCCIAARDIRKEQSIYNLRSHFEIIVSCAYSIKELAPSAEVETKVKVMGGLPECDQRIDVWIGRFYESPQSNHIESRC